MSRRIDDLHRQIELAALIAEFPEKYSEEDLAAHFFVSVGTIRRDVKAVREMGIDVRSRKLSYRIDLSPDDLNLLITTYWAFGNHERIKNLPLILEKFRNRTLFFFVQTMKAIEEKKVMEIEYRSGKKDRSRWRTVTPVAFYNGGKTHYLIAIHEAVPKMYTIERISGFRFSNEPSPLKEIPSLTDLFKHAWGSYTGGSLAVVRLRFRDDLEQYMSEKFWVENQEMKHTDEGFEVKLKIRLSNEFIAWVMGWGDAVTILEPPELRDSVFKKASDIVSRYKPGKKKVQ
jgi:predicted DNA-binding transcriptional regulator YafY